MRKLKDIIRETIDWELVEALIEDEVRQIDLEEAINEVLDDIDIEETVKGIIEEELDGMPF